MNLSPIGTHLFPKGHITFYQDSQDPSSEIKAKISSLAQEKLIPVRLPELPGRKRLNVFSTANKVARLLMNQQLYPEFSERADEICFLPIAPEKTQWEKGPVLNVGPPIKSCICRFDGSLSYATPTQVITWDWKQEEQRPINIENVTALAENDKGALVIGDKNGQLRINKNPPFYVDENKRPIKQILPFDPCHFLVTFMDKECLIIDASGKIIKNLDKPKKTLVTHEGKILILNGNGNLNSIDDLEKIDDMPIVIPYEHGLIADIQEASSRKIMILSEKEHLTIWDTDKDISEPKFEVKPENEGERFTFWQEAKRGQTIWLEEDKIAIGEASKTDNGGIWFHTGTKRFWKKTAGSWNISSIIPLSNGSIIYGTGCSPSGIHVVSKEGKVFFSKNKELTEDKSIEELIELIDGSVAVKFHDSFMILQPKINSDQLEDAEYRIEKTLLELRYHPTNIQLYLDLAKLYDQKNDHQKYYETLFLGLGEALKQKKWDDAFNFYEKTLKAQPNNGNPCQLFIKYLELSSGKKLKKEENLIRLKLYEIQKNNGIDNPELSCSEKRCKKRLFIGEGDFTYTEALTKKHKNTHPKLSEAIIATELNPPKGIEDRINKLEEQFVKIKYDIDGTLIHEAFPNKRFKRIHWNCPFGDPNSKAREAFKEIMPAFFRSSSQLQKVGDRIHVTLVDKSFRQEENPIVAASTLNNYRLIKKRKFGDERYPGYVHVKTGTTLPCIAYGSEQEFIFEKTEMNVTANLEGALSLKDSSKKKYKLLPINDTLNTSDLKNTYFGCSTDNDSTDYYDSDECSH
jgi:tetratricopeptide (TPR) repeat protein